MTKIKDPHIKILLVTVLWSKCSYVIEGTNGINAEVMNYIKTGNVGDILQFKIANFTILKYITMCSPFTKHLVF